MLDTGQSFLANLKAKKDTWKISGLCSWSGSSIYPAKIVKTKLSLLDIKKPVEIACYHQEEIQQLCRMTLPQSQFYCYIGFGVVFLLLFVESNSSQGQTQFENTYAVWYLDTQLWKG